MKKILFSLLILCASMTASAQVLPKIDGVKMRSRKEFRAADTLASETANFLLSTPSVKDDPSRLKASSFLINWMDGTPDYTFALDENVVRFFDQDLDLMGVYMASLTSVALQNKSVKDTKTITINAVKRILTYIDNPNNHVKITAELVKLSEANQKGELVSFLKL